jgi:hypothetical protein
MSKKKESRADYFRQRRRKNSPARNAAAERDAARKRKARGGYKTAQKQYEEFIASLPPDQQVIARAFYEYPQSGGLGKHSTFPLKLKEGDFFELSASGTGPWTIIDPAPSTLLNSPQNE